MRKCCPDPSCLLHPACSLRVSEYAPCLSLCYGLWGETVRTYTHHGQGKATTPCYVGPTIVASLCMIRKMLLERREVERARIDNVERYWEDTRNEGGKGASRA